MKKGILIQAMLAIAVIAAVMVIYIISTGTPVLTRLERGQTIDSAGNITTGTEMGSDNSTNALLDNQSGNIIPEITDDGSFLPEIAPDIAPRRLHKNETEQPEALTNAESAYLSLIEYVMAYNGILLPPAVLPPDAPFPQANQNEMDKIDADKISFMGYLPAAAFTGTLETGNICENLRTEKSNMTVRLCEDDNCDSSNATKDINDVALIIFSSDNSYISNISYSPELPGGYNADNFTVSIRNIEISTGVDEESYSQYGDLLVVTTTQLTKSLCE